MREQLRVLWMLSRLPFRRDRGRAAAGILLLVVSQTSAVAVAFVLKSLVDAATVGDHRWLATALILLVTALAVSLAGTWLSFSVRVGLNERVGQEVDATVAALVGSVAGVEHLERPDYLDRIELLRQERMNLAVVPDTLAWTLALAVRLGISLVALVAIHPSMALLPLAAVPALWTGVRSQRRGLQTWDAILPTWRRQFAIFQLGATEDAGRETRVFGLQDHLRDRFRRHLDEPNRQLGRALWRSAVEDLVAWGLFSAGVVAALRVLADAAITGSATAGDFVLALTLAVQLNLQLTTFVITATQLLRTMGAGRRLMWLADYAAGRTETGAQPAPSILRHGIVLDNVSFAYPGTSEPVLRGADLHLHPGSTVALVGENGAGKTTIVKLLTGMYTPTGGRILIDGTDLRDLDLTAWRARTSACFQDHARFEFTALDTVGCGDLPRRDDRDAVTRAIADADANSTLERLPAGLDTQLGRSFTDGVELSGGQWQKIALARGLLRREPLLLALDEPTASLDPQTEAKLFERYSAAAHDASKGAAGITLLVSHRFSTVRSADLILVVADGRIEEQGTHEKLVARGGRYADLYELQARSYR